MKHLGRPRTLLGLTLFGLGLVTLPLVFGIGHAMLKLGQLANASELVVAESTISTLQNQRVAGLITDMERNARQYLVLGEPNLLAIYRADHAALMSSLEVLRTMPQPEGTPVELRRLGKTAEAVLSLVTSDPQETANEELATQFELMRAAARNIAQSMRLVTNERLGALQSDTRSAQRSLAWQTSALVPGTLALVVLFLLLVGRPMRQVDRAIRELGAGDFDGTIKVTGPRDIEKLGRQLEWLRHRLKESTEEKDRFLRHMSHELKTPLANIREGTELLLDGTVGPLDREQQEVTAILRENGVRLQGLIENLLLFSAWQTRTVSIELTRTELEPLVRGILRQHRLIVASRELELEVDVSPVTVRADQSKLTLVLENLISNAIKFTPAGGRIYVGAHMQGDELVIDVADTGPGVAAEDAGHIFEAFYQGRRPQDGPVGGTGIGLSVVAECCEAHGGTVELLTGRHGLRGAHFQARLPLARAEETRAMVVNA